MPNPRSISPTQAVVVLGAGVAGDLVAANPERRLLILCNIGVNPVSLSFGAVAPVAATGYCLEPAATAGRKGGELIFSSADMPIVRIQAISALGSSVVVIQG